MKISKIEFQNFRNFKDRNVITCSTDGKMTIIYGLNGDGKTTLHQLFQWVFYNEVHFNKTANDKLYNLVFEKSVDYGEEFNVWATIDFEHEGDNYSLRREWIYKKELKDSKKISEDLSLMKKDDKNNWNVLTKPDLIIDEILPPGLSEYFFFDGESMLADLRVKGRESANKLRRALYSMFDLDLYEDAINHIGYTDRKTTVLGRLFLSKSGANDTQVRGIKADIENTQTRISNLESNLASMRDEKKEREEFVKNASEEIGGTLSKKHYEQKRRDLQKQRDENLRDLETVKGEFGKAIIKKVPRLFAAKAFRNNAHKINVESEKSKLIPGVKRKLIASLLKEDTCVCGQSLGEKEHAHLKEYLNLLPPKSYIDSYSYFEGRIGVYEKDYEVSSFTEPIQRALDYSERAKEKDAEIAKVDEAEKNSDSSIQELIDARQDAEERIKELTDTIEENSTQLKIHQARLRKLNKKFDEETAAADENKTTNKKIELMEAVRKEFESLLEERSVEYSEKLEEQIQLLLNEMLTSKRTVSVTSDFFVRVFDSNDDESKSEGQFAVVSFAYIGGVFKLLQSVSSLKGKEYPLVLDGPFSKLDNIQRQNVIDGLPGFAPQTIIFSKDNLQDYIDEKQVGHIWTLQSNEEKNIATIKEGFLW